MICQWAASSACFHSGFCFLFRRYADLKTWMGEQDGVPPLGWSDTIAYLVLPVLLIASQYVSMQMMQPATAVRTITH